MAKSQKLKTTNKTKSYCTQPPQNNSSHNRTKTKENAKQIHRRMKGLCALCGTLECKKQSGASKTQKKTTQTGTESKRTKEEKFSLTKVWLSESLFEGLVD